MHGAAWARMARVLPRLAGLRSAMVRRFVRPCDVRRSLLLAALLLGACSNAPKNQALAIICTNAVTGLCEPCIGQTICVDPLLCQAIACAPGDITFGDAKKGPDTTSSDVPDAVDAKSAPDTGLDASADLPTVKPDSAVADSGCSAGQPGCTCPDPCPAIGLVECLAGVPAIRTCQLGADKCLSWGTPVACKPGETCSLGQCLAASGCNPPCTGSDVCQGGQCVSGATGSLGCAQVSACIAGCQPGDDACKAGCTAQGTLLAQTELKAFTSCMQATCKAIADAGKQNETMFCVYTYCGNEAAACLGAGSGDCAGLNNCLNGCGSSAICTSSCNADASKQAATDFYGLMTCVDDKCGFGSTDATCAQNQCSAAYQKCLGSGSTTTGGGTLTTCAQIAQCQGACNGNVACAKACTAAGTDAAKAAVNAFINCRDGKCGSFCPNGAQCSSCVLQYCAAEFDACSY